MEGDASTPDTARDGSGGSVRGGPHCSWSKGIFLLSFRSEGGLTLSQVLRHSVGGFSAEVNRCLFEFIR